MTDFRFRWLVLSAVGAAFVFSPLCTGVKADDAVRAVDGWKAAWTIRIGTGNVDSSESSGIVISPSNPSVRGQAPAEQDVPILLAPAYDEEPAEDGDAANKPEKRGAKKSDKSPVATETASQKAREEWQKKRANERQKRQPKSQASVEPKKTDKAKSDAAKAKASDKVSDAKRSKAAATHAEKAAADAKKKAMAAWAASETKAAALKAKAAAAHAQSSSAKRVAGVKDSRSYREIYNSIPFSRAEYDANPGYRHQATMEIMLGQLHPIIVAPPAPPRQETRREVTVRFLPSIRPGYRAWSRYPWH